jgi:hypothetical protein
MPWNKKAITHNNFFMPELRYKIITVQAGSLSVTIKKTDLSANTNIVSRGPIISSDILHFDLSRLVKDFSEDMTLLSVLDPTAACAWNGKI